MELQKAMPRWQRAIAAASTIAAATWLFATRSVWGLACLAAFAYLLTATFSASPPLTPAGLIDWIAELDTESKIAVLSSLLTVAGFLAAFAVGISVWKRQTQAQYRKEAADAYSQLLIAAARDASDLQGTARLLLELRRAADSGAIDWREHDPSFIAQQCREAMPARFRLIDRRAQMGHLKVLHEVTLSSQLGGIRAADFAGETLTSLIDHMNYPLPANVRGEVAMISFIMQADAARWERYISVAEVAVERLFGVAGMMRSAVATDVFEINLARLRYLLSK